ncbi:MAG: phosphohistidine phosphatase, partial [Gammaproteobacteria bacterium]
MIRRLARYSHGCGRFVEMPEQLTLTLIRHAKSSWQFAGMDDFHRPLNRRGLDDAVWMPAQVAKRVDKPQVIYCSGAVRAVQTCQALVDEYGFESDRVVVDPALYLATAEEILVYLRINAQHASHVFVVAHNPGLTNLFNHLVVDAVENLPTLSVAHLHLPVSDW